MRSLSRLLHIFVKIVPSFLSYKLYSKNPQSKKFDKAIVRVRVSFQELGATFIKLGQLLSARPDIVGPELANELRKLLDKQVPLSYRTIKQIVEKQLGEKISAVFKEFEHKPISTASIGQVHRAVLKNGQVVAIKVRRQGLVNTINSDLKLFKKVAKYADKLIGSKGITFSYIYQEFSEWILNELDFQVEGRRSEKLLKNLSSIKGIKIPKVYWEYTTEKVLVMEYLKGMTFNELLHEKEKQEADTIYDVKLEKKYDFDLMIKDTIEALVKQIFVDKFFHGDLHPANIIALDNGKVAFIDFGIMGNLNDTEHTQVLLTLLALVENDPQSLMKLMLSFSSTPLSKEQESFLQQEFARELHRLHGGEVGKASLSHFVTLLLSLGSRCNIVWTSGLVLSAKTLSQVDFIAMKFGLKTSVINLIKPGIEKYIAESFTTKFSKESIYKTVLGVIEAGKKLPESISDLQKMLQEGVNLKVDTSQLSQTQGVKGKLKLFILIGISVVLSIPIVNHAIITNSEYQLMLTLSIPLIIYYVLSKII